MTKTRQQVPRHEPEETAAAHRAPPIHPIVEALPISVPFVAPEAHERRLGRPLKLRLGANESVFGASPQAVLAMAEAAAEVWKYCDPESHDLRHALAERHDVGMDNLVVGSGIDDLLGLIARAFVPAGESVVTSLGGYPTFEYFVAGCGGRVHHVPYRQDRNDLEGLAARARAVGARVLYLANPDNPSGSWWAPERLAEWIETLPRGCLLVLDEAYVDFLEGEALPLEPEDPRLVRLRTFSKAHGMAGARIGYAIASRRTVQAFGKIRVQFGVNKIAQAGALASLQDPAFVAKVVRSVAEGRRIYESGARDLGLGALPSATNFVALDLGAAPRARAVMAALFELGVFVRMPGAPPLDRCIRVTVGTKAQCHQFVEALGRVVGNCAA